MRLFIAIPISEDIRSKISELQKELKSKVSGEKIRWINPQSIHLTLKFLGEVDKEKVEQILKLMGESVENISQFKVKIANGGVFPNNRRPRVLWIGCDDPYGYMSEIKKNLDEKLKVLGFISHK